MMIRFTAWALALVLAAPSLAQEIRQPPSLQPQLTRPVIRTPLVVPRNQAPANSPTSNTPPVHFDLICRNVTGLGAGWGGNFYFACVRADGQTEQLRIARAVDDTGVQIGGGQAGEAAQNSLSGMVQWVGAAAAARHFEAMTSLGISEVVQAFMLFKASHPDSPVQLSVRGIESLDPANAGDRVVAVASFNLN